MSNNQNVKRVRLTEETAKYVDDYVQRNNVPYDNQAINKIIEEHMEMTNMKDSTDEIVDKISNKISNELNKEIRRTRIGTNHTDRNTQIIIELLNGFFFNPELPNGLDIITTEDAESNAVQTAKETVQNRIEKLKQKKHDHSR